MGAGWLLSKIKRFSIPAAAFTVAVLFLLCPARSSALPQTIWESVSEEIITRGVTLEKIERFTADGWLNADVMRIDLTEKNISLEALYNAASLQELTPVKEMAERQGAVAAINGGYFEWNSGWGGSAIGTAMQKGVIDTAFAETNAFGEVMCSVTVSKLNEVFIGYCRPAIALKIGGLETMYVNSYNKKNFYDYRDITIYDRKYVKDSIGASNNMPDIVEMVVEGGKIKEIRVGMPAVEIPANGFVAITRLTADGTHAFSGAGFAVGAEAGFEVTLTPGLSNAVMHIEGASMLVRGGEIPVEFSYEPGSNAQRNPRTMVGRSKDGKVLTLATVDGRRAASIGLTTRESAEFMLALGAYDAVSLDGGGSTTMVARKPGWDVLEVVNTVSDSSPRAVINGIGVFTNAPKAALRGAYIETADQNVFVGARRQFVLKAYDRYFNPMSVKESDVVWAVTGFQGKIQNGLLVAESAGDGFVKAKVGRASATLAVKSLSTPSELVLDTTQLTVKTGEAHAFAVTGRDRMGYSAQINPSDITWSCSDGFGRIEGGVFTRENGKPGYITAAFGAAAAYCAVQGEGEGAAPVALPPATKVTDPANRPVGYKPNGAADTFRFGVLGEPLISGSLQAVPGESAKADRTGGAGGAAALDLAGAVSGAFANVVNNSLEGGIYVGAAPHVGASYVNKATYATNNNFEVHNSFCGDPSRTLIRLSAVNNGLRAAGGGQWEKFLEALDAFKGRDLFIALQQGPSTFGDRLEADLLKRVLAEKAAGGKCRVWVFYGGPTDSVWLEDGVRYFTCAGAVSASVNRETGAGAKYLEVTVQGDEVAYEFKQLT